MAIVGYARVSSRGQSLDVQREKLAYCDKVFEEKETGTSYARPQLTYCMGYVREGDMLVVTRLDRLARSTLHLCQIVQELQRKGVTLHVLDQAIETATPTGRLLFHLLAAIAEFETELRKERQADGIALARKRGVRLGKERRLSDEEERNLYIRRRHGWTLAMLQREYGISQRTVYRIMARQEQPSAGDEGAVG